MRKLLNPSTATTPQTIICLLRHGKTDWNEEMRIQGRKNSPLSKNGVIQVHQWGKFLHNISIDRIISSDLGRVKETVAIIQTYIPSVPVEYTADLREQSWGDWEGKTFDDLHTHHAEEFQKQVNAGWDFCPPGGESRQQVLARALAVTWDIFDRFPGEQILLVSHEGIVKSLIYHLAGRNFMPDEKKIIQKRQLHLIFLKDNELVLGPLNIFPTEKS